MGLLAKINVTSEFVFKHISDLDIFSAYRDGDVEVGAIESSRFREDSHPSCGFYINAKDKIIYSDIATSEKLDCFAYVAKLFGITYKQALEKVAEDFGLTGEEAKFNKVDLEKARKFRQGITEEKRIEIIEDSWSKSYIDYWTQFHLTKQEVEKDVKPVKALFINGKIIPNYTKSIRFAYPLTYQEKTYYKIYTPYNDKDNFRWINNIPIYMPFGIFDLPFKSNVLIITKAQKDRLLFKKFFTDVIGVQNESPSSLRDGTIEWLNKKYDRIYINMDNDAAGEAATRHYEQKGFVSLSLPSVLREKYGIKDVAEMVQKFGVEKLKGFLKFNNLLT